MSLADYSTHLLHEIIFASLPAMSAVVSMPLKSKRIMKNTDYVNLMVQQKFEAK
jgi:hypothetical protein